MKSFRSYLMKLDRSATDRPRKIDRKKLVRSILATTFVAGSQLVSAISVTANPVPTPAAPSTILPIRGIFNGSFEAPIVTDWDEAKKSSTTGSPTNAIAGGNIREAYLEKIANPAAAPIIWRSTETGGTRSNYGYGDAIEVWRGTPGNGGQSATSGAGVQYAELNGSGNASLYQDICVLPNEEISWSLRHAVRKNGSFASGNPTNIMQVSITDIAGWTGKTPPVAQTNAYYSSLSDFDTVNRKTYPDTKKKTETDPITSARPFIATKHSDGWKPYTGSWTSTNTSTKLLRFAFGAIQGSNSITFGNFIDDVQLNLAPIVDFLPSAGGNVNLTETIEGNPKTSNTSTPYYYLSLRVNGEMQTAGKVQIALSGLNSQRSFRLGTVLKGNAAVTGLKATPDSTTSSGGLITLDIPAGTYNPNLPDDYIHIPIDFSDLITQSNDNLTFTLNDITGGTVRVGSSDCRSTLLSLQVRLLDDDSQRRVELPVRIAAQ
jgi:hypothetical protein